MTTPRRLTTIDIPASVPRTAHIVASIDVGVRNLGFATVARDGALTLRHFDTAGDPALPGLKVNAVAPALFRDLIAPLPRDDTVVVIEKQIPLTMDGTSTGECMAIETALEGICHASGYCAVVVPPVHTKAWFPNAFKERGEYDENKDNAAALMAMYYNADERAQYDACTQRQRDRAAQARALCATDRLHLVDAVAAALADEAAATAAYHDAARRKASGDKRVRVGDAQKAMAVAARAVREARTALAKARTTPRPYKTTGYDMDDAACQGVAYASALWERDLFAERTGIAHDVVAPERDRPAPATSRAGKRAKPDTDGGEPKPKRCVRKRRAVSGEGAQL